MEGYEMYPDKQFMFSGEKRVFVDPLKSYLSFHSNNTAKFEPKQAPQAIEYVENINC